MNHTCQRIALVCLSAVIPAAAHAQLEFEREPIRYHDVVTSNPIAALQQKLDDGRVKLPFDDRFGYLPAVLEALKLPLDSQVLVFSKTSLQLRRITAYRPRALYFDDETYIGYVQFGDVLEVATTDPSLGAVFYTLSQDKADRPQFVRDKGQCLICHASSKTQNVPGHVVRSVFADRSGQPAFGSGTWVTDHTSDFSKRFGGWYVTGKHGTMRHMGNSQVVGRSGEQLDREAGANVTDLSAKIDLDRYLRPTSDIVSLMVLQHQTQMHNYITLANMETQSALHYNQVMAKALGRGEDYLSDSTRRRIDSVAEKLVRYLFFSDEFELADTVRGNSGFTERFSARQPRDSKGRSLFQLDLSGRLLRYPCSWLVYTSSFDQLPQPVFDVVARRMNEVLSGADESEAFEHLTSDDRLAIRQILTETKPNLAKVWSELPSEGMRSP